MKKISMLAAALVCAGLAVTAQLRAQSPGINLSDILLSAETAHARIPLLSAICPGLDETGAMAIQRAYVQTRLNGESPAGFKAGLTSKKGQERFGLTGPVAGVLFCSGKRTTQTVIDASAFHLPMIETEIGFVLGQPLNREIKTQAILRAAVREVVPVIELPELGFEDMNALKGVDIIAANVSSRQFILGIPRPAGPTDLNALEVSLSRNGKTVNKGIGSDALGDQWETLRWLANTMIRQGYSLEPGQVLITGALGRMMPGETGKYLADYKNLGIIAFEIR